MKQIRVCTILFIGVFCLLLLFNPLNVFADSVTVALESTGGVTSGPGYVYPYYFSVDGSSVLTPLMCISFKNDIGFGETWTAVTEPIQGNLQYEEAAYIFSLANAPGATETEIINAQWANWQLFDPDDSNLLSQEPSHSDVASLLSQAALFAQDNPNSSLYSQYSIFAPEEVNGSWPAGYGEPQFLIGDPVPEPGSFILLGSGLLGLAGFLRLRLHLRRGRRSA
jgi:hypothetical protein